MLRSSILIRIKRACNLNAPLLQSGDVRSTLCPAGGKFERPLNGCQSSLCKSTTSGGGRTQQPADEPQKEQTPKETISGNTETNPEEKEVVTKQIMPKHEESIEGNTSEDLWSLIKSRMKPRSKAEQEKHDEECNKIIKEIFGNEEITPHTGETLITNDRFYSYEPYCNITKESVTVPYKDDSVPRRLYDTNEWYCKDYSSDDYLKPSLIKDNFRSILCNDAIVIKDNEKSTSEKKDLKSSDIKSTNIYDVERESRDDAKDKSETRDTKQNCEVISVDSHWNNAYKDYQESSQKFDSNQAIDMETIRVYHRIKANKPLREEGKKTESKRLQLSQEEMSQILFGNPYENDFIRNSTTAKKDDEKLIQKIEHIDETPLVEAGTPKIDELHDQPKVLGNSKEMTRKNSVDTVVIRYDKKPLAEIEAEHNLEHQTKPSQPSTAQRNDPNTTNPYIEEGSAKFNEVKDPQKTLEKSEIVADALSKRNLNIALIKHDQKSLVDIKEDSDPPNKKRPVTTFKGSNLTNVTALVEAGNPKVDELHEQPKILQKLDNMGLHDVKSDKRDNRGIYKYVSKCGANALLQTKPGSAYQTINLDKKQKDDLLLKPSNMTIDTWMEANDHYFINKPDKEDDDKEESVPNETIPEKVFNIHMDPKHVLTCNETCAISPNPLLKNANKNTGSDEVNSLIGDEPLGKHDEKREYLVPLQKDTQLEDLQDTTQLLQETTQKMNKTTEKLQDTTEKLEAATEELLASSNKLNANPELEEMKSNKLSHQGALTSIAPPVAIPESEPKPDDEMKLSEILRLVRERNHLLNIQSCLEAKKNIPPLSQPMDRTKVFPAPDYQKLRPFPKICVPKAKPKKDKCIRCDLNLLGLDENFRRHNAPLIHNIPEIVGSVQEMLVVNEDFMSDNIEDIILQLQSVGYDLRAAYDCKKRELLEAVMLMKSIYQNNLSDSITKLNRSKDYDPWNAIPGWPYWKKYERPKLQTPKDGYKLPPPSPQQALPGGMKPSTTIPTYPVRLFTNLEFITVSLDDDHFDNHPSES